MEYIKRLVDNEIEFYLDVIGAILIVGPKWCGKTTTAEQHSKSILKLQDKDMTTQYLRWADVRPSKLLEGEKPRLIDEWQEAPVLWDAVRNSVDETQEDGLYILTGSTAVDESKIMHSGAGRIHRLVMRPMSLYENNEITHKINEIGKEIMSKHGKPKAILAISTHWYSEGSFIQKDENPEQIFDMYGFPEDLYELKYSVKGFEKLTNSVCELCEDVKINNEWGIDHGTWSILIHLFPNADIPVVQLSVNKNLTPDESFKFGKKLSVLRNEGYLIFASGNIVHNLMEVDLNNDHGSFKTEKFNDYICKKLTQGDFESLINYKNIADWKYAIPTPEHYLPLLYILGASNRGIVEIFNNTCNLASISMTSCIFDL